MFLQSSQCTAWHQNLRRFRPCLCKPRRWGGIFLRAGNPVALDRHLHSLVVRGGWLSLTVGSVDRADSVGHKIFRWCHLIVLGTFGMQLKLNCVSVENFFRLGGWHCAPLPPPPPPPPRYTLWNISPTPSASGLKLSENLNDPIFKTKKYFSTASAHP